MQVVYVLNDHDKTTAFCQTVMISKHHDIKIYKQQKELSKTVKLTKFSKTTIISGRKNRHSMFVKIFQVSVDEQMRKYLGNLVEFSTQKHFQIGACMISARKAKHQLMSLCLHTLMQTRLSANQSART